MTCGNDAIKNKLGQAVKGLGELCQAKDLPKRPLVMTFIPIAESVKEEVIRARLGGQNRKLKETDWILTSKEAETGGLTLRYPIDEASFGALRTNLFSVFYGLVRLTFKVLGGLDGGNQGLPNKPAAE
ncbi:unnamed protein product [Ceutorhynchus assimilis]|uniref:DUF4780 domain-containing protein n=1 Tax=Ceutorhynchus assimilis TaxID=467358 RepID=A0A9N9MRB0_9CUCU|nr:unnamed protein product [Ceutorhynchus assimilis]